MNQDKQPWNPFPLFALDAGGKFDLSACAISILIYLAARSNYTGWTCVGHKRIQKDLRRSKDFVTEGLKELYAKGLVKPNRRGRKNEQADSRILSQEILPEQYRSSPAQQGQISNPATTSNPDQQDYIPTSSPAFEISSPAQQGETLQYYNLAENQSRTLQERLSEVSELNEVFSETEKTIDTGKEDYRLTENEKYTESGLKQVLFELGKWTHEECLDPVDVKRIHAALFPDGFYDPVKFGFLTKLLKGKRWAGIQSCNDVAFRLESPNQDKSLLSQVERLWQGHLRGKRLQGSKPATKTPAEEALNFFSKPCVKCGRHPHECNCPIDFSVPLKIDELARRKAFEMVVEEVDSEPRTQACSKCGHVATIPYGYTKPKFKCKECDTLNTIYAFEMVIEEV